MPAQNKIAEQLKQLQEDMDSGKVDWKEAKKIAIADLRNEYENLKKELEQIQRNEELTKFADELLKALGNR